MKADPSGNRWRRQNWRLATGQHDWKLVTTRRQVGEQVESGKQEAAEVQEQVTAAAQIHEITAALKQNCSTRSEDCCSAGTKVISNSGAANCSGGTRGYCSSAGTEDCCSLAGTSICQAANWGP